MFACKFSLIIAFFCVVSPLSLSAAEHEIRAGDTIAKIAKRYGVSQKSLMRLNNIDNPSRLHLGDVLIIPDELIGTARRKNVVRQRDTLSSVQAHPKWSGGVKGLVRSGIVESGGVKHTVLTGQTIAMIARAYNTDPRRLARRNRVTRRSPLKAGRELFIPGAKRSAPVRTSAYRPHRVRFIRIKKTKRLKLVLIHRSGSINMRSRKALSRLLGYRRMHPRLVVLLQRVAERFPGHAFEIISGYRKPTKRKRGKKRSPHARGTAVDFRLQGVSNELLYDFISSFDKVGAGYYPNSIHVHLDVRDKKHLWTDISGRGEPALYVNPGEAGHWDTIKDTVEADTYTGDTETTEAHPTE